MTAGAVGILGAGRTSVGKLSGVNSLTLHADATRKALRDAKVEPLDIDGIITLGSFTDNYVMHSLAVAEYLGLRDVRYSDVVSIGGASAAAAVPRAVSAVERGQCDHVLIVSGDDQLTGLSRDLAVKGMAENRHAQYESPYGITTPAAFAILATLYLDRHGLDSDFLAYPTVQSRRTAAGVADAMYGETCTVDDILESKPIADPLRLLHCAPIADGGGAVVVGRADGRASIQVVAAAEVHSNAHLVYHPIDRTGPVRRVGDALFAQSGLEAEDVELAQIYDCFASVLPELIEGLRLVPEGEALKFFADGHFDHDGPLPINLNGGLLSGGHPGIPGGILHLVEAVEQMRETARLQVWNGGPVLVHCMGGILSTHASLLLERS